MEIFICKNGNMLLKKGNGTVIIKQGCEMCG